MKSTIQYIKKKKARADFSIPVLAASLHKNPSPPHLGLHVVVPRVPGWTRAALFLLTTVAFKWSRAELRGHEPL